MSRRAKLSGLLVAAVLSVVAASAAEEAAPPATSADAPSATTAAPAASGRITSASRPIFIGLLAAVFLLVGGLVGANDRLRGGRPASKRPPAP